jgi:hypothetical protein
MSSSMSWLHDMPHSVGLLWTSDQSDAENSTWQHKILKRLKHPCHHGMRNHTNNREAADPLFGQHAHLEQVITNFKFYILYYARIWANNVSFDVIWHGCELTTSIWTVLLSAILCLSLRWRNMMPFCSATSLIAQCFTCNGVRLQCIV